MNEREIEETVDLLHRYFDEANPSDPAGNIRLIKRLAGFRFSEQAGRLILLAPAVILEGLHQLVDQQFMQALSGIREDQLDYQLKAIGLALVMEYAHLIQSAGRRRNTGCPGIEFSRFQLRHHDEHRPQDLGRKRRFSRCV